MSSLTSVIEKDDADDGGYSLMSALSRHDSLVLSTLTSDHEVVGSSPAGCGPSRSNRGPVALCTLVLGLLNPPSSWSW